MNIVDFIRELQAIASENPNAKMVQYEDGDMAHWEIGEVKQHGEYVVVYAGDTYIEDEQIYGEEE